MFWTVYIKISFPLTADIVSLLVSYMCVGKRILFSFVPYVQQQELGTVNYCALAIWKYNHDCGTLTWQTVENI